MDSSADAVHVNTELFLCWHDRLKVLFGIGLHVDILVETEYLPGKILGRSRVWLERWPWDWRSQSPDMTVTTPQTDSGKEVADAAS